MSSPPHFDADCQPHHMEPVQSIELCIENHCEFVNLMWKEDFIPPWCHVGQCEGKLYMCREHGTMHVCDPSANACVLDSRMVCVISGRVVTVRSDEDQSLAVKINDYKKSRERAKMMGHGGKEDEVLRNTFAKGAAFRGNIMGSLSTLTPLFGKDFDLDNNPILESQIARLHCYFNCIIAEKKHKTKSATLLKEMQKHMYMAILLLAEDCTTNPEYKMAVTSRIGTNKNTGSTIRTAMAKLISADRTGSCELAKPIGRPQPWVKRLETKLAGFNRTRKKPYF